MDTINWRPWMWQYILPMVLLAGSFGLMFLVMDDPDVLWVFIIAPVLSVVTGYVCHPRHIWITPAVVGAAVVAGFFVANALGQIEGFRPVGATLFGIVVVALPLTFLTWLGRAMRGDQFGSSPELLRNAGDGPSH